MADEPVVMLHAALGVQADPRLIRRDAVLGTTRRDPAVEVVDLGPPALLDVLQQRRAVAAGADPLGGELAHHRPDALPRVVPTPVGVEERSVLDPPEDRCRVDSARRRHQSGLVRQRSEDVEQPLVRPQAVRPQAGQPGHRVGHRVEGELPPPLGSDVVDDPDSPEPTQYSGGALRIGPLPWDERPEHQGRDAAGLVRVTHPGAVRSAAIATT
jgi:hypothetical protein